MLARLLARTSVMSDWSARSSSLALASMVVSMRSTTSSGAASRAWHAVRSIAAASGEGVGQGWSGPNMGTTIVTLHNHGW